MDTKVDLKIENTSIRKNWDEKSNQWQYSIVDVVALVTKSSDPRNYWKVLKNRLKKGQNKLVTECNQLKLPATDGKSYLTDTANSENILKIVKLIAPQYTDSFKQWFDNTEKSLLFNTQNSNQNFTPTPTTTLEKNTTYPQSSLDTEEFLLLVDGYYQNNFLIIEAFVAGLDPNNLFISATCEKLTIEGVRTSLLSPFGETSQSELAWGKFSREIDLPTEIDIDKIETKEKDGLITVRLPIKNKNISRTLRLSSI